MSENETLTAGPETDRRIAELLGWTDFERYGPEFWRGFDPEIRDVCIVPRFSSAEGAAVRALMAIRTKRQRINMTFDKDGAYAEINTGLHATCPSAWAMRRRSASPYAAQFSRRKRKPMSDTERKPGRWVCCKGGHVHAQDEFTTDVISADRSLTVGPCGYTARWVEDVPPVTTPDTDTPGTMTEDELREIERRVKSAHTVCSELCSGKRYWRMSIPARPDDDPDLVIGASLSDVKTLVAALRSARERAGELERALADCTAIARRAFRYRDAEKAAVDFGHIRRIGKPPCPMALSRY